MAMLWIFTKEHYPAGDIGKADDVDIEDAVCWPAERGGELIPALVAAKLLDESSIHRLIVHDWSTHCVPYIHAKLWRSGMVFADGNPPIPKKSDLKEGERSRFDEYLKKIHWPSIPGPVDNPTKSSGRPVDLEQKPLLKGSEKKRSEMNPTAGGVLDFPSKPNTTTEDAWGAPADPSIIFMEAYPKQTGIQLAIQTYVSVVKDPEHAEVMAGLERWKQSEAWGKDDGMYIPEAHKWLTDRRWKDHPKPRAQPKEERIIFMSDIPMRRDMR